ncbi:MAG: energy transducer TonB, partial [Stellaceae bacterium]
DRLKRWLNKYKRYPEPAQKDKQQGQLVVSFTILRDGTVLDPRIEHSSGFPLLDAAALQMLRDASPVPPLPQSYRAPRVAVDLPVQFSLGFFARTF